MDLNSSDLFKVLELIAAALVWAGGALVVICGVVWRAARQVQRVMDRIELYGVVAQDHENRIQRLEGRTPGKILDFPKTP